MRGGDIEKESTASKRKSSNGVSQNHDKPLSALISISGVELIDVDSICNQIKEISQRTGIYIRGPVPLSPKILKVPSTKDSGAESSETSKIMRIHRREIRLDADERALRQLMKLKVPEGVNIKIDLGSS